MTIRQHIVRLLNVLWLYVLCFVLIGAYIYQYYMHQDPCPLCELQRLAMIVVAIGPILNIWTGIRPLHYGLSLMAAIFGGAVSLRQISLHICPGFSTFGYPVFGFGLYTWAFFVFVASALAIAFFLFLYIPQDSTAQSKVRVHEWMATILMFLIAIANVVTTILQCGVGPCSD